MVKQLKLRNKILKVLPKAVAAVTMTFQNPPFSPGRDHKSKPIVSMIPHEARRKTHDRNGIDGVYSQEPTSPKISCMGQIKHKKKQIKQAKTKSATRPKEVACNKSSTASRDTEVKKHASTFQKMLLFHAAKPKSEGRKSNASAPGDIRDRDDGHGAAARAPHVSQMRRFSSGRDALANFDWRVAQAAAAADEEEIDYYSDDYRVESSDGEEEDEEVMIPFSAPILVGGGVGVLNLKPRKEINLWKRRTMAPPMPLQLHGTN
ncbi:uncharacterized protein At1g76070-like [Vigna unguiculata]|uniref:Syringolide-induced protein 14-1-1 n=1 Tax=Vigna unguiculata TaxID=3917 RepID=A0A4D6NS27_VIGUN|nr:uncharacterized protein At1g76070-like [Vigna unguiculata]QCE16720.1 hypothetical protein DEO72_LG11g3739 [Vigna unguiculata]